MIGGETALTYAVSKETIEDNELNRSMESKLDDREDTTGDG